VLRAIFYSEPGLALQRAADTRGCCYCAPRNDPAENGLSYGRPRIGRGRWGCSTHQGIARAGNQRYQAGSARDGSRPGFAPDAAAAQHLATEIEPAV
jgi:hypothetical protein